ncbi:hypothetical protein KS4_08460 [Poriferisphaera corsica]|uniref:Uncharacterized protein n=1 Tax=Poriferisphaera corsica TaxID=2528020 RepID=A0A517YRH2_9BACT|nr:hypothetical protein [Poriferisphaera corsica]QDU32810.1 hypothetical protein KS4_08460 [Poriferisphaera corsica]
MRVEIVADMVIAAKSDRIITDGMAVTIGTEGCIRTVFVWGIRYFRQLMTPVRIDQRGRDFILDIRAKMFNKWVCISYALWHEIDAQFVDNLAARIQI